MKYLLLILLISISSPLIYSDQHKSAKLGSDFWEEHQRQEKSLRIFKINCSQLIWQKTFLYYTILYFVFMSQTSIVNINTFPNNLEFATLEVDNTFYIIYIGKILAQAAS